MKTGEMDHKEKNQRMNSDRTHRGISVWLDSYDDIFSDFDPRQIAERNISDDFLQELKKISGESDLSISNLKLLMPVGIRSTVSEATIIKRLHSHFISSYNKSHEELKAIKRIGLAFILTGLLIMVGASYISFKKPETFLMNSLVIILEPAGWFSVWYGFENLFATSRRQRPELNFYRKIAETRIEFENIAVPSGGNT